jgi:hypothetical protein
MTKKILLAIVFSLFLINYCYSQKIIMEDILNIRQDIITLENRITELIKNNPDLSHIKELQQFHIFCLSNDCDTVKDNYINHSFLYKLYPSYYYIKSGFLLQKKKYLTTIHTLICDSIGNLVAQGDARYISNSSLSKENKELSKMYYEQKIDFVFYMGQFMTTYICIKNNDIYVLKLLKTKEWKLYPFNEFINSRWEEFIWFCKPSDKGLQLHKFYDED